MGINDKIKFWTDKGSHVLRLQHKSWGTEKSYVGCWRLYFEFCDRHGRGLDSRQKMEKFLTHLAVNRNVSATTQNLYFNAILFFYRHVSKISIANVDALRARRGERVRSAPSIEDTHRILNAMPDVGGYPTHLIARLLYGRGLRLMDALQLRIKDLDFNSQRIIIRQGKGGKDRVVRLDDWMVTPFKRQMVVALTIWESDVRNGVPIWLPHRLGYKYPEARFSKHWAWLFPQLRPCKHPRSKETVRFHMHPANVQRAFKLARLKTGVNAIPHEMRHAHATHLLEAGANVKALQQEMGHVDPRTTLGYCHADALSVPDPNMIVQRPTIFIPPARIPQLEYHE